MAASPAAPPAAPPRGGGRRARARARRAPLAEINVTPFVDVMLVLLVVFMVTAPLLAAGVEVELPRADAPAISEPSEPLVLTLRRDGSLFLQETEVNEEALAARLAAVAAAAPDARVFVRADAALPYGEVLRAMALARAAGIERVALVSEREPAP